jgi:hypothetical protein
VLTNALARVRRARGGDGISECNTLVEQLSAMEKKGELSHEVHLDTERRMDRLFFQTGSMVDNFKRFGQFIQIDATCKTNRYDCQP